ncbi:MAG: CHAD domain-containing protein [Candidatus Cyclobacteriaceae bacterium M2_1C_046]
MSIDYQLHANEELSVGTRRIIRSLHHQAIDHIEELSDPHETVHDLRKRFKEIRAVLRLVRHNLGEKKYKEENIFYRDLGREIAEVRDIKAYLEMIDLLKEQYDSKLYKNVFQKTEKEFNNQLALLEEEMDLKKKLRSIKERLKERAGEIDSFSIGATSFKDIEDNIFKVYKRGYKGLENAKKDPTPDNFHEWRKRAKYIMYQTDIMEFIWPGYMKTMEKEFHQLSDILGDHHDLTNLLKSIEKPDIDPEELKLIKALANNERSELEKKAYNLGERLYAEKPKKFISRLKKYYLAHENSYTSGHYIPQVTGINGK